MIEQYWLPILVGTLPTVISLWITRIVTKMDAKADERRKHDEEIFTRIEQLEVTVHTLIEHEQERAARMEELIAMVEIMQNQIDKISTCNQALARDRMMQSCKYFVEESGWIPLDVFENIEKLFKAYKDLGGNGACEKLYNAVKELPNTPSESGN